MSDPEDFYATEGGLSDDHVPSIDNELSSTRCPHCNGDLTAPEDMDMELVYATLHFYYDDPDSMRRFRECNQAADVKSALWKYDRWLRDQLKYHERDDWEGLQVARDRLWIALGEHGVNLDDE
jgi:hypothetical protein